MQPYDEILSESQKTQQKQKEIKNNTSSDPFKSLSQAANMAKSDPSRELRKAIVGHTEYLAEKETAEQQIRPSARREVERNITGWSRLQPDENISELRTGVFTRPTSREYTSLFTFGREKEESELKMAMFQLQQREQVQNLMSRSGTVKALTQGWDPDVEDPNGVGTAIHAPNMLTKSIAERVNQSDEVVITNKKVSGSSFHPKMGYVSDGQGANKQIYAFAGTQNITPALDSNNTLESLLVLDAKAAENRIRQSQKLQEKLKSKGHDPAIPLEEAKSDFVRDFIENDKYYGASYVESAIGAEVIGMTDDLIKSADKSQKDAFFSNTTFKQQREKRKGADPQHRLTENFTLYNQQILEEYNEVLDIAARRAEKEGQIKEGEQQLGTVYLSMNRLDALMKADSGDEFNNIKENLKTLSKKGKLSVVTDRDTYKEVLEGEQALDREFLETLSKEGSIKMSPLIHHEKAIGITDRAGNLVYMGIQSANITQGGMSFDTDKRREDEYNTEVMTKVSGGFIFDERFGEQERGEKEIPLEKEKLAVGQYLEQSGFKRHITRFDARDDKQKTGYKTETQASSYYVDSLKQELEKINAQVPGEDIFEIKERYAPGEKDSEGNRRSFDETVGLRVRVKSSYSGSLHPHGIEVDLTVNKEGNVLLSDLNKVVGGSLLHNQTQQYAKMPGGIDDLKPNESRQLTSMENTISLLTTMSSELGFQNRYGLTNFRFRHYAAQNRGKLDSALEKSISEIMVRSAATRGYTLYSQDGEAPDLTQIITNLPTESDSNFSVNDLLETTAEYISRYDLSSGREIRESRRISERRRKIDAIFSDLRRIKEQEEQIGDDKTPIAIAARIRGDEPAVSESSFLDLFRMSLLSDAVQEGSVFEDLRSKVISDDPEMAQSFRHAAQTQSRQVLSSIFDPYLSTHDNQTTFMQQKGSLPVYQVTSERINQPEQSRFGVVAELGVMDPATFGHGTQFEPGRYQRPLAATAYEDPLQLSGYGGVTQVKVIDESDLNTGAAKVFDMPTLMKGVAGYGLVTIQGQAEELADLEISKGITPKNRRQQRIEELKEGLRKQFVESEKSYRDSQGQPKLKDEDPLYVIPYPKQEQITQRFKNVTGARAAFDVSPGLHENLMDMESKEWTERDLEEININKIRLSLPKMQYDELKAEIERYRKENNKSHLNNQDYENIRKRLARREVEPLNQKRGIVGPNKLKRVALHSGFNLLGDYAAYNADYRQPVAETKSLRVTLGLQQTDNLDDTLDALNEYLSHDVKVIGQDLDEAGMYKWYQDGEQGAWKKVGSFTESGLIQIDDPKLYKTLNTVDGTRKAPVTMKFGSYGKGFEKGVSVFNGGLNLERNARGTLIAEQYVTTIWEPNTGSRPASGGQLPKHPQLFVEGQTFESIKEVLDEREKITLSENRASQQVYALSTFDHFKGFTTETGLSMLADPSAREQIKGTSDSTFTKSLAMMFTGDEEVKQALVEKLRDEKQYVQADALEKAKSKIDVETSTQNLSVIAQGLSYISDQGTSPSLALSELKQKVKEALKDEEKSRQLKEGAISLIDYVMNTSIVQGYDNEGREELALNEFSTITRSAGLMAHSMHFTKQLFESEPKSVGGLYEAKVPSPEEYLRIRRKEKAHKELTSEERRKKDFAEFLAASRNIRLQGNDEQIRRRLELLRSAQEKDLVLETYADMTQSKTLVSAGQKDEVNFEFHYFLGLSTEHIEKFKDQTPEAKEMASIQEAYSTLTAATMGGFHKSAPRQIGIKIPSLSTKSDIEREEKESLYEEFSDVLTEREFRDLSLEELGRRLKEIEQSTTIPKIHERKERLGRKIKEKQRRREAKQQVSLSQKQLEYRRASLLYADFQNIRGEQEEVSNFQRAIRSIYEGTPEERDFYLKQLVENLQEKQKQGYKSDIYKDYLHGMVVTHRRLQEEIEAIREESGEDDKRLTALRRDLHEIRTSQQVVIPNVETREVRPGVYQASLSSLDSDQQPAVGILMGNDLLQNLSLIFGDHKDSAIIEQRRFIESLYEAQPILQKLYGTNVEKEGYAELSSYEVEILNRLRESAQNTSETLKSQVTNETMRQASGDHERFTGGVGYAVQSFALSTDEMVLGDRFGRIAEDLGFEEILKSKANELVDNIKEARETESLIEEIRNEKLKVGEVVRGAPDYIYDEDRQTRKSITPLTERKIDTDGLGGETTLWMDFDERVDEFYQSAIYQDRTKAEAEFEEETKALKARRKELKDENREIGKGLTKIFNTLETSRNITNEEVFRDIRGVLEKETREKIENLIEEDVQYERRTWGGEYPHYSDNVVDFISEEKELKKEEDIARGKKNKLLGKEETEIRSKLLTAYTYQKLLGKKSVQEDRKGFARELKSFLEILNDPSREKEKERLNRELNLKIGGVIRRTGMPAGGFAMLGTEDTPEGSEELGSRFVSVGDYNERVRKGEEGKIIPDMERSSSIMMVPALGTTVAGLGDFDGDSYQLLLAQAGKHSKAIAEKQREQKDLRIQEEKIKAELRDLDKAYLKKAEEMTDEGKLSEKETTPSEDASYTEWQDQDLVEREKELEQRQKTIKEQINKIKREEEEEIDKLHRNRLKLEDAQTKQMDNIRKWVQNFTSLPGFAFSEDISTPETFNYISQKFDISGVEDANYLKEADRKIELFGDIIEGQQKENYKNLVEEFHAQSDERSKQASVEEYIEKRLESQEFRSKLQGLYGEDVDQGKEQAKRELKERLDDIKTEDDYRKALSDFYAKQGNVQMGMEKFLGQLEKADGQLMNPYDFEAVQTAVGEAGSKLIGSAYNTLIPLLERSMVEQGLSMALRARKKKEEKLEERNRDSVLDLLESEQTQEKIEKRYQGTFSMMTAFQQLVRDALKAKSGTSLAKALKEDTGYQSAIEELERQRALENKSEQSIREAEENVRSKLRQAIQNTAGQNVDPSKESGMRKLREQLGEGEEVGTLSEGMAYDDETTAFGALLDLADFTKTKDDAKLHQLIKDRGLEDDFSRSGESRKDRYIAKQLVDVIERTEAIYKASTIDESGKQQVIDAAERWYQKSDDKKLEEVENEDQKVAYEKLIGAYKEAREKAEGDEKRGVDESLVKELIYENIKERNRSTGALDEDTILNLREEALTEGEIKEASKDVESDFEQRFSQPRAHTMRAIQRQAMRGHTNDPQQAAYMTAFRYQAVEHILAQMGYDTQQIENLSGVEKEKVKAIVSRVLPTGAFSKLTDDLGQEITESQRQEIISIMAGVGDQGEDESGFQTMRDATAATSRYTSLVEQLSDPSRDDSSRAYLSDLIEEVTDEGKVDVDKVKEQMDAERMNEEQQQKVMEEIQQLQEQVYQQKQQTQHFQGFASDGGGQQPPRGMGVQAPGEGEDGILFRESALEGDVFGAFSSAALFSLMAEDKPEEERLASFATDSLMGLVQASSQETRTKEKSWTRSLMGDATSQSERRMRRARVQQALRSQESLEEGIAQGVSQELISEGLGSLAQKGVEKMIPVDRRPRGGTAMAGVASEVLGSVMSQSVARTVTGAKDDTGTQTQEFLGNFLHRYIEQTWQAVIELQEAMLNSQDEVIDTDTNNNISFSPEISEMEWDMRTGLIILDQNETPIRQVFDGLNSEEDPEGNIDSDERQEAELMATVDSKA